MSSILVRHAQGESAGPRAGGSSQLRRTAVFLLGGVVNLLGVAAGLVSTLISAPLLLAGVWVWSREFEWAERLLGRLRRWTGALWRRVKAHPVTWGTSTAVSVGGSAALYWWLMF